jgi:hypothetical protein
MPSETTKQGYQTWVETFTEAWAAGDEDTAVNAARKAETLWRDMFGKEMERRAQTWDLDWPLPGCPEADEVVGWQGWYGGGYGGTLA